jgi:hypothetical protein
MAQSKEEHRDIGNSFLWGMGPAFMNPMVSILADMNGTFMEGLATAQKDWADFVQRRIREDVVLARQLMNCQSLPDMHQIYAQYLQTAFEQYREQSEKVVQRGTSIAKHLTEATEKEAARTRH